MDGTNVWLEADLERQLKHEASHDELTGLPNRGSFVERLESTLGRGDRRRLAVMLLDVDDLTSVNDGYGHVLGDILLMEMAIRIKSCVRNVDTVARLGSDEFALLIEDGDETAAEITHRVLGAVEEPFLLPGSPGVPVSVSVGIAFPSSGEGAGEVLRNAAVALNVAKRRGKQRAVTFADATHREMRRRIGIEATLNRAVRDPEEHFALAYQPVYATVGRRIVGFEALLRWEDPGLGSVPPAELIPVAEATGAIVRLGRWVLNRACRQAAEWQRGIGGADELRMSVNLSPVQFSDPALVDDVAGILATSGLVPQRLILEITETALVTDVSHVVGVLSALKRLGVKLAIDDFGTGQSSLSHLARYPVDLLKIDRSFLGDVFDTSSRRLLQGTIELGRRLGLSVVVEGAETEPQAAMLPRVHGVFAQGFLYSRPLSAEAASALLEGPRGVQLRGTPAMRSGPGTSLGGPGDPPGRSAQQT